MKVVFDYIHLDKDNVLYTEGRRFDDVVQICFDCDIMTVWVLQKEPIRAYVANHFYFSDVKNLVIVEDEKKWIKI